MKGMSFLPIEIPVNNDLNPVEQQKCANNEIILQKYDSALLANHDAKECGLSCQMTSSSSGTVFSESSSTLSNRTPSSLSTQLSNTDYSEFRLCRPSSYCFLNIGGNRYVSIHVQTPDEYTRLMATKKDEVPNESPRYRKRPGKKRRHRKNFDQNVKKRILDLYLKLITEDPSYSIRNVALAIYNTLSKEA